MNIVIRIVLLGLKSLNLSNITLKNYIWLLDNPTDGTRVIYILRRATKMSTCFFLTHVNYKKVSDQF